MLCIYASLATAMGLSIRLSLNIPDIAEWLGRITYAIRPIYSSAMILKGIDHSFLARLVRFTSWLGVGWGFCKY